MRCYSFRHRIRNSKLTFSLFFLVSLSFQVHAQSKARGFYRLKVKQGQVLRINQDSIFIHHKDTVLLIPKGTNYEFVNQNPSSNQNFYDSLKIKYGDHKVADLLFSTLLVNTDTSALHRKKQALVKSEEVFMPFEGLIIDEIILKKVAVITGSVHDTTRLITSWAGRTLDNAHIYTKDRVILNNLLFESGDEISPYTMADNERLLRSLPFIEDTKIIVTEDPLSYSATVTIITKDVWSIGFGVKVNGLDEHDVEIYDRNFLGQGNQFSNTALINTKETPVVGYNGKYLVNNIKGSFINSFLQYKTAYNEETAQVKFDKLFLTPQTKYAGGLDIYRRSYIDQITTDSLTIIEEDITFNKQEVWMGRSFNVPNGGKRRNVLLSTAYSNTNYVIRPIEVADDFYFDYHHQKLFLVKIALTQRNYYKGNFVNRFGITEDIPVGSIVSFTTGKEFGEFKDRPYFGISYTKSIVTPRTEYWTTTISLSNFVNRDKKEDALFNASVLYFSKLKSVSPKYKLRYQTRLFYSKGFRRVNDETLIITEQKGIRGFNEPNLNGNERLSFKLEGDVITSWNVYGFRFIPYAFADIGFINNISANIFSPNNFYSGFGIGMRVRNESLVFSTFEFRLAFYPKVFERSKQYELESFSGSPFSFQELNDSKPKIDQLN